MTERTYDKVMGEVRYEFTASSDARLYMELENKPGISPEFRETVGLLLGIARQAINPTEEQLKSLSTDFPRRAPSDISGLVASFRTHVAPLLEEAAALKCKEAKAAAAAAAGVGTTPEAEMEMAYQSLEMDMPKLLRGMHMNTFGDVSRVFPDEAALLVMLEKSPSKRNLTMKQVENLLSLPERIENHDDFQQPPPNRFLADYRKMLTGPLTQLKAAMKQGYPPEEKTLGDTFQLVMRHHGQKLRDICDRYRNSGHKVFQKGEGLDAFLEAARQLNTGPFFNGYSLNRDKLHEVLTEAVALPNADRHPIFGPLLRGLVVLEDAKSALTNRPAARNDLQDVEKAHNHYVHIKSKLGFAKDAVQRQMQQAAMMP